MYTIQTDTYIYLCCTPGILHNSVTAVCVCAKMCRNDRKTAHQLRRTMNPLATHMTGVLIAHTTQVCLLLVSQDVCTTHKLYTHWRRY